VAYAAHGVQSPRMAYWWPVAFPRMIEIARLGFSIEGWFYPVHPLPTVVALAAHYLRVLGRLGGQSFPLPERCDLETAEQMVTWLVDQVRDGRPLILTTLTGAAVRLAIAAKESGRSLAGVTLHVGSEAVTDTRRELLEASGAQIFVGYGSVELPRVSSGCASPVDADDMHLMSTKYALGQRSRSTR
jgi:hypothetical protein